MPRVGILQSGDQGLSNPLPLARLLGEAARGAPPNEEPSMQYLMLIYEDESVYGPEMTGEAVNQVVAKHMAFHQAVGAKRLGGAGLKNTSTATTVRIGADGKQSLHDGPFAETKEQLGGFYLVEADDLDEAIAIAKQVPVYATGSIEVRPLMGQGERKGD